MKVGKTTVLENHPNGTIFYATNMLPKFVPWYASQKDLDKAVRKYEMDRKAEAEIHGELEE